MQFRCRLYKIMKKEGFKDMYLEEKPIIDNDEIGKLYLTKVLLEYCYPRVFICEDTKGQEYLFYETCVNEAMAYWLVTQINKEECESIINRESSFQSIYNKENKKPFVIKKVYGIVDGDYIEVDGVEEHLKRLPVKPVYYTG